MAIAELIQTHYIRFTTNEDRTPVVAVASLVVAFLTYYFFAKNGLISGVELVGVRRHSLSYMKAKNTFITQGRKLILDAVKKAKGRPFSIVMLEGPNLIFSSSDAKTIGAEKRLTMDGFLRREFFITYPGFTGIGASVGQRVVQDAVRIKLTQSLGLVTKDLCEETAHSLTTMFGESPEWTTCRFPKIMPDFVARLSTRVFLGPVVARNEEWLKIAVEYTYNLVFSARALRQVPALLRPFAHYLLPMNRRLMKQDVEARRIIDAEIARRQDVWDTNHRNGEHNAKLADSLGWMQELAADRGIKNFDLAGGQLGLTFAAIHTTSDLLSKSMFRVARNPEYQNALRTEMIQILSEDGWKKTSLYKMKFMDSFLKEVQRLEPANVCPMNRTAEEALVVHGIKIPKGAPLKVVLDNHFNPEVYPEPESFDPYRYLNLRNQPGQENNWQFVSVSNESLGFGLGKHACPGRFFASNEVKIAMCWMLIKYEWRIDEEPRHMNVGTSVIPDPATVMHYRRRQEEIDLSALNMT